MYKMMFSLTNINNGILSTDKAMPMKDSTSNNEAGFQMDRKEFIETIPHAIHPENKWIGGSRDASDVARRRRLGAVGKGSINTNNNQISFTSPNDINSRNSALRRVRSGGAVAPAKKGAARPV
jgi:hypothetical protein